METIGFGSEIGDWWMRNKQAERFVKPSSRSDTEKLEVKSQKGKKWRIGAWSAREMEWLI
jgi:hypothetical protein